MIKVHKAQKFIIHRPVILVKDSESLDRSSGPCLFQLNPLIAFIFTPHRSDEANLINAAFRNLVLIETLGTPTSCTWIHSLKFFTNQLLVLANIFPKNCRHLDVKFRFTGLNALYSGQQTKPIKIFIL